MGSSMTREQLCEALEERQQTIDDYLKEIREIIDTGMSLDRREMQQKTEKLLEKEQILDDIIQRRFKRLQKQAEEGQRFIDNLKDDTGAINRRQLLKATESLEQSIFDHAVLIVGAKEGNAEFIRRLSNDHRAALGILESKSVEDRLNGEIERLQTELRRRNDETNLVKQRSEKATSELQRQVKTKREQRDAAKKRAEKAESELSTTKEECKRVQEKADENRLSQENLIITLKADLDSLRNRNTELEGERDDLSGQRAQLQTRVDEQVAEIQRLKTQHADIVGERDRLRAERNRLRTERNGLRTERSNLQTERDELRDERDGQKTRIGELKFDVKRLEENMYAQDEARERNSDQIKELNQEANDRDLAIRTLKDEAMGKDTLAADLRRQISSLEGQVSSLEDQVLGLKSRISDLDSQIIGKANQIEDRDKQITDKDNQISKLKDQHKTKEEDNRKAYDELTDSLRKVSEEKQLSDHTATARELGLARYFAVFSGFDTEFERWVPFARIVAETDIIPGSILDSVQGSRPWRLLLTWRREQDQHDLTPHPASPSRVGVIDLAGRLFARALARDCEDEPLCILQLLVQRLFEDASAPVTPVLLALEKYLELSENLDISQAEVPVQLFIFGLWQAAALVARGWPSTEADQVRDRLRQCLNNSPFLELDELLRDKVSLEAKIREGASSGECFFSEDQSVALFKLPRVSDWIFVLLMDGDGSIRMIHNTRGEWASSPRQYRLIPPTSGQEMVVPARTYKEIRWFITSFRSRNRGM
ncbi:hypothetical protein F4821DRAFT_263028 [Hypoxylon rubiginosum]|uniref:Uncharacterized protein n=1 Tax=Hypoxylon rubiginosum TaxID=110542 RepID=A0ACC0CSI8_9PEZI|nr:hypothetical protein F4821DRAFT_263028 [Hypoxylon rubiginosum]